jgi:hypothetical protein
MTTIKGSFLLLQVTGGKEDRQALKAAHVDGQDVEANGSQGGGAAAGVGSQKKWQWWGYRCGHCCKSLCMHSK